MLLFSPYPRNLPPVPCPWKKGVPLSDMVKLLLDACWRGLWTFLARHRCAAHGSQCNCHGRLFLVGEGGGKATQGVQRRGAARAPEAKTKERTTFHTLAISMDQGKHRNSIWWRKGASPSAGPEAQTNTS